MKWLLGLMLLAGPAVAQRAVMEGVAASRYTIKVDTTNARVLVDTTSYTGGISNVGLFVASNVVVGTLADKNACVIYATGSVTCLGVRLSSGPSLSGYVPYSGATSDLDMSAHQVRASQFSAGTAPSTNFVFDGLTTGPTYIRATPAPTFAAGYYWGGAKGYSLLVRGDLTDNPFVLRDETLSQDRAIIDTNGGLYWIGSLTASSGTLTNGLISGSSVTASAFFGDGSHLTGVAAEVSTNTITGVMPIAKGGTGNTTGQSVSVASGGVDFSTITTALSGKAASFVGITSSCAAGYYLSSGAWSNGVLVGGGCILAGGISGHTISTGAYGGASTAAPSQQGLKFDSTYFSYKNDTSQSATFVQLSTGLLVGASNNSVCSSVVTGQISGAPQAPYNTGISTVSYTIDGPFWMVFSGSLYHNNGMWTNLNILYDGKYLPWLAEGTGIMEASNNASSVKMDGSVSYYVNATSATALGHATHNITLVAGCPGTSGSCFVDGTKSKPQFCVVSAQGRKGDTGATGAAGTNGVDGVSVGGGGWTSNDTKIWFTTPTASVIIGGGGTPIPIYSTGTYTPTASSLTNLDSVTPAVCNWDRLGNIVRVFCGLSSFDPTSSGATTNALFTLPVASALTAVSDLSGNINFASVSQMGIVYADVPSHNAKVYFLSSVTSAQNSMISFTYVVR